MEGNIKLLLPVVMPVAAGIVVLLYPGFRQVRKSLLTMVLGTLALETVLVGLALAGEESLRLWQLTDAAALILGVDGVSRLFAVLTVGVWLLVGVYSTAYMEHEQEEYRFFGFYLIVLGVLLGLDFSGNLITMYVWFLTVHSFSR